MTIQYLTVIKKLTVLMFSVSDCMQPSGRQVYLMLVTFGAQYDTDIVDSQMLGLAFIYIG